MPERREYLLILSMDTQIVAIVWFHWGLIKPCKKVMQLIKGESSFWINKHQRLFNWNGFNPFQALNA